MDKNITPLPWKSTIIGVSSAGPDGIDISEILTVNNHERICESVTEINAAFIVRAVNSHEELVKAAKAGRDALLYQEGISDDGRKALEKLEAAISKAEGE